MTAGSRSYYAYRYEGKLNSIENAVVLISYPKDTFISTDVSLSTREILDRYIERWPVEVFFGQGKDNLAFETGYAYFHDHIQEERTNHIYQCGVRHVRFADGLALVA